MEDAVQARHQKAQNVVTDARAQAERAETPEQRARIRANALLEAELLTQVCDYVQADKVRI